MSHSSTSSSETPAKGQAPDGRAGPRAWTPRAAVAATLAVVVLNLIAGYLIPQRTDWLPSEPRILVTRQLAELREAEDLWLLGSSTLAQGILPEMLSDQTGRDLSLFKLGSAGPRSLTEMAITGLKEDDTPPEAIFLFYFKDSMNANKPTLKDDIRYVDALKDPSLSDYATTVAPIFNYRESLKFNIRKTIALALVPSRSKKVKTITSEQAKPIDNEDMVKLMASGVDYRLETGRIDDLAALCNEKDIALYIVITPTAEAAVKWQDKHVSDLSYQAMIDTLRTKGEELGYEVLDYTQRFPSTTQYFRDPFHIRSAYMPDFTETFAEDVNKHLSGRE